MIGIDEVGRGAWAGPLLVVAFRLTGVLPLAVQDSKLVVKRRRELLVYDIQLAGDIGEGWVSPREIDEFGLTKAMKLGVARSLAAVKAKSTEEIIIDGPINYCDPNFVAVKAVINADALHPVVSAASIYAKVLRDTHMLKQAQTYSHYGFEMHVGYGTKRHQEALNQFGITAIHRRSYKPLARFKND